MFRRFSSSAICIQRFNRKLPACSSSCVADIFQVDLTRGMAGHSKWANIKHTKGLKDAQKSSNAAKIVQRLKIAVVEGGSTDPKLNFRIARIMQQGKELNVSKDTMERALKNIEKTGTGQKTYVEAMGPGNFSFIVEVITSKLTWTRQEIQSHCKKHGARIGGGGTASHSFELKGIVETVAQDNGSMDLDAATEIAIEAGAEDVRKANGDDGEAVLQFICEVQDLHQVKTSLEEMNHVVNSSSVQYEPITHVTITDDEMETAYKLFEALETIEEVSRIYDNIEVKS